MRRFVLVVIVLALLSQGNAAGNRADGHSAGSGSPVELRHDPAPLQPPRFGVSVDLPAGWVIHWHPVPNAVDPRGIFTATTHPSQLRKICPHLDPGEAYISLGEETGEYIRLSPRALERMRAEFPQRPRRFHIGTLQDRQFTCGGCSEPRSNVIRFTDHGRMLYIWVIFGSSPDTALGRQVRALLDSVRVRPG